MIKREEKKKAKKVNKKLLFILMATIMILTIMATTMYIGQILKIDANKKAGNQTDYSKHFALIVSDPEKEFWQAVCEGAQAEGDKKGVYVELFGKELDSSMTVADLLRMATAAKVDGIILENDSSKNLNLYIEEANLKKIPIVTVLEDTENSSRISHVGISYYNLGQQYAEQIVNIIKAKNSNENNGYDTTVKRCYKVCVLMNEDTNDSSRSIIYSTIQNNIQGREDIRNYVDIDPLILTGDSVFEAEEDIRNQFIKGELPDIILCLDEINSASVYQAIVDYNQVGNVELVAFYTGSEILSGIEKNIIFSTSGVDTRAMGADCVEALTEYMETGYSSDYYSVDTFIVNSHNLEEFIGGDADE